jgi:hypothetical protein
MEKVEQGVAEDVEATLLSSPVQYVYVEPHSTTWAEFEFGIGDRSLWLNGRLNIDIRIEEDPDDYYGQGGTFGTGGAVSTGGTTSVGGSPGVGGTSWGGSP